MKAILTLITTILLTQAINGQSFVPQTPNTKSLKSLEKQGDYSESLGYLYLKQNYTSTSEKDSINYYEWEPYSICSFYQEFQGGITYKLWQCQEGGGRNEQIAFPKMTNKDAMEFVNKLFHNKRNAWISEFQYVPDEPGCGYKIEHSFNQTKLIIYCGC
jgi:hypothetical protein